MRWLRLYDELVDDPKVQELHPMVFRCYINLLCLANRGNPRGRIDAKTLAFSLRLTQDRVDKMVALMVGAGLIEQEEGKLIPHGWDRRQFASDNVTERVREHRRNVPRNVTSNAQRNGARNAPEADTDPEAETETYPPHPPEGEFEEFWSLVVRKEPSRGKALEAWLKAREKATAEDILAGLRRFIPGWEVQMQIDPTKIPHITTWLNQERWTVENPTMPTPPANGLIHEPTDYVKPTPEQAAKLAAERKAALAAAGDPEERWRKRQSEQARAAIPRS